MRSLEPFSVGDSDHPTLSPQGRGLDHAFTRVAGAVLRPGNRLDLWRNGPETYDHWLTAIAEARQWVHLENYIFHDGAVGRRFADALTERAAAGVSVRVLYDWFGSLGTPRRFWRRLRDAGVDVRALNPPRPLAPLRLLRRDHRKALCVDGRYGSVGGVCIADEWLERAPDTGLPFRDTAVAVHGAAVADLERAFADVWSRGGAPLPPEERAAGALPVAGDAAVRVVAQEPGKMRISRLLQLITAVVRDRLWIADAYFLGIPFLSRSLMAAAQDGVDVRLLLPATSDLPFIGTVSRAGYRPFLEAGARIWEYRGPMMHAKTIVADGWWARVGSTNMNPTGLMLNWELDVVAEDRQFARAMEEMFEDDLADADEIALRSARVRPRSRPGGRRRPRGGPSGSAGRTSRAVTVAARVGRTVFSRSRKLLTRSERAVAIGAGAVLAGVGVVGLLFPRVLAWPLAALALAGAVLAFIQAGSRR